MKYFVTADWHIGRESDTVSVEETFPEGAKVLTNRDLDLLTFCNALATKAYPDMNVRRVIVAGDVFDGPAPTNKSRWVLAQCLKSFEDRGVHVYVMPGNHDCEMEWSALSHLGVLTSTFVHFVSEPTVLEDGVTLVPHPTRAALAKIDAKGGIVKWLRGGGYLGVDTPLVVAHGTVAGREVEDEEVYESTRTAAFNLDEVRCRVLLGHEHDCHEVSQGVAYVGAPLVHRYSEIGATQGYASVTVDQSRASYKLVKYQPTYRYVEIRLDPRGAAASDVVAKPKIAQLLARNRGALAKVVVRARVGERVDRVGITEALRGYVTVTRFEVERDRESAPVELPTEAEVEDARDIPAGLDPTKALQVYLDEKGVEKSLRSRCLALAKEVETTLGAS